LSYVCPLYRCVARVCVLPVSKKSVFAPFVIVICCQCCYICCNVQSTRSTSLCPVPSFVLSLGLSCPFVCIVPSFVPSLRWSCPFVYPVCLFVLSDCPRVPVQPWYPNIRRLSVSPVSCPFVPVSCLICPVQSCLVPSVCLSRPAPRKVVCPVLLLCPVMIRGSTRPVQLRSSNLLHTCQHGKRVRFSLAFVAAVAPPYV